MELTSSDVNATLPFELLIALIILIQNEVQRTAEWLGLDIARRINPLFTKLKR